MVWGFVVFRFGGGCFFFGGGGQGGLVLVVWGFYLLGFLKYLKIHYITRGKD